MGPDSQWLDPHTPALVESLYPTSHMLEKSPRLGVEGICLEPQTSQQLNWVRVLISPLGFPLHPVFRDYPGVTVRSCLTIFLLLSKKGTLLQGTWLPGLYAALRLAKPVTECALLHPGFDSVQRKQVSLTLLETVSKPKATLVVKHVKLHYEDCLNSLIWILFMYH